jgi:hypothetical protein
MARFRWFIAGAAAATGALVTAPGAYQRLREALTPGAPRQLPPGDWPERDNARAPAAPVAEPAQADTAGGDEAAADAAATAAAMDEDEETLELRMRIEETRARIQRRASEVSAPDFES